MVILERYKQKGQFCFRPGDSLSAVCNAPNNCSGIYIIYAHEAGSKQDILIYIGISGREGKNGEIIHRKDGLRGRFLTGKQFGDRRQHSWTRQMKIENIESIRINWYVTHGEFDKHIPRNIEKKLLEDFVTTNKSLPRWNKKL